MESKMITSEERLTLENQHLRRKVLTLEMEALDRQMGELRGENEVFSRQLAEKYGVEVRSMAITPTGELTGTPVPAPTPSE